MTKPKLLKQIADVGLGIEDADFWLQRKGDRKNIGKPIKLYHSENIGIKLNGLGRSLFDPQFLYYYFVFLHSSGHWGQFSRGTLRLQHLSVSHVKNFSIPMQSSDNI